MIESNGYKGAPIIADIDNDGEMEVAVRGWYHITTLDLDTGTVEKVGTFRDPNGGGDTSGRGYGWWGAINVDGESNPELEIVILGDIEQFISVIGWDNGELKRLWRYNIEVGTSNAQAKHDTGVAPVADVDGDGLPEIVTSIFNKTGDQRWHVMVFDGINGAIECDLVDSYLTGLEDVDARTFVWSRVSPRPRSRLTRRPFIRRCSGLRRLIRTLIPTNSLSGPFRVSRIQRWFQRRPLPRPCSRD